jgi:hypothetical protein
MRQGHLATTEAHDHSDGVCDLPKEIDDTWGWPPHPHCRHEFVYTGVHVCCCAMCHGDFSWDIRPGKRQRIGGRKYTQGDWAGEYESWDAEYEVAEYNGDLNEESSLIMYHNNKHKPA